MKYSAARGPPDNIIIDRRSVNDRTFGFENCPDFGRAGEKHLRNM